MKKIILSVVAILCLVLLVSCSSDKSDGKITSTDYSVKETLDACLGSSLFPEAPIVYQNGSEKEFDEDYLDYYFGNSKLLEGVTEYIFITSSTTSVNEIGVFKVNSASAKDALTKAFETRRDALVQTHTNYSATDLEISKNMVIGSFDDVVYFIATPDNGAVEALIK